IFLDASPVFSLLPSAAATTSVNGFEPPCRSTYSSPSRSSWCGLKYSKRLGSVSTHFRPNPKTALTRMTATDSGTNGRDQNARDGSISTSVLLRGTAQPRNGGYIAYAHTRATTAPSTPPSPSSRNGLASTINKLPNPSDAHTIDQNDAGNVMRRAAAARAGDVFPIRSPSVCQLNVM